VTDPDPAVVAAQAANVEARYAALCARDRLRRRVVAPRRVRGGAAVVPPRLPTYYPDEDFLACRPPGAGPEITVNAIARFAIVELSVPAWRHEPPYPKVRFGARRSFEATIGEIAELVHDVRAALAGVAS
jgi:hypothetical protein